MIDARGRGAAADVCLCDCRCPRFNPSTARRVHARFVCCSAWADGCLIASMSSVAHFHEHEHRLQPSYDVDLERSAADTRHATMLAQSCDGVSELTRRFRTRNAFVYHHYHTTITTIPPSPLSHQVRIAADYVRCGSGGGGAARDGGGEDAFLERITMEIPWGESFCCG